MTVEDEPVYRGSVLVYRFILVAGLLSISLRTSAETASVNKAKARESYRLASQSYDLGEYHDALSRFKEAYRYYEEPSFLFNIGQCHRQLGERQEAIRFFRTYLVKSPNAPNRVDVEQMIAKLEAEQAREDAAPKKATAQPEPPPVQPTIATSPPVGALQNEVPRPSVVVGMRQRQPVYKKWWLWTVVGVVAAGAAAGIVIGVSPSTPKAATTLGTIQLF